MIKYLFAIAISLLLVQGGVSAQESCSALIPMPNSIVEKQSKKSFRVTEKTVIMICSDELDFEASYLQNVLSDEMGVVPQIVKTDSKRAINLIIDNDISGVEHYTLDISNKEILIKGSDKGALLYGIMTLRQILIGDHYNTQNKEIAALYIDDQPRFTKRMLMLDPARNFLPIEDVKRYIDVMARYKYNVLQIHLTDDQGWRIEIKKHPKLTEGGSFYTQEQLKDLIKYAARLNIEIVPEIDIPGHTVAILAAYPELSCSHLHDMPKVVGETENMMLCCSNSRVYEVLEDILDEVALVFPAKKIHLGGDEAAIDKNWAKCEHCQDLKKQLGYEKSSDLMNYFFGKVLSTLRKNRKEAIFWCELDNIRVPANNYLFHYPDDVTLVTWRYGLTPKCLELTEKSGHPLVMAPGEHAYLDYPQYKNDLPEFKNWGMPITTLKRVYELDPGYGLPADKQSHVIGVCGTLWGEAIKDINRVFYMTYPRGLALAEAGWSQMESRSWDSFKQRLYPNLVDLMKNGVSFRVPFECHSSFIENR